MAVKVQPMGRRPTARFATLARRLAVTAAAMLVVACGTDPQVNGAASALLDDFGDTVRVLDARRIVSLNPVTTELLVSAGLHDRLIGRTRWDLYPQAAAAIPDLGDGISPNIEVLLGASPDLVVLYATTANRTAAARLRVAGIATLAIRTDSIGDLPRVARALSIVLRTDAPVTVADSVIASVEAVRRLPRPAAPPRVFWRIGERPLYTVGRGSFLAELIHAAGGAGAFDDAAAPSLQVTIEDVVARDPDVVVVGPVGHEAVHTSPQWRTVRAVREGRVLVYDTALVGRPGVRLGEAAWHLRRLLVDSARVP